MFFEAKMNGKKYEVYVVENRSHWRVSLKKGKGDWNRYEISKEDYRQMDDAVSFLFKKNCYMLDVVGDGLDYTVYTRGSYRSIKIQNDEMLLHESLKKGGSMGGADDLKAGMPGKIVKVMVEKGQKLKEGDPVLVMEAMKMENEMKAAGDCIVKEIKVVDGQSAETGALLVAFDPVDED